MTTLPPHVLDPGRLAAVRDTGLLDTPAEEPFDRLTTLAAELLSAPWAFLTVVDDMRSFWKSCVGTEGARENAVEESFCQYVIGSGRELIVGDVTNDPITASNPSIASMGIAAWAGFPVHAPTGEVLGTFCVVDSVVRTWTVRDVDVLRVLSLAAANEIALRGLLDDERTYRKEEAVRLEAIVAAERAVLLELQQTMQPAPLVVPGLELGCCYLPADGAAAGGDLHDWLPLTDGTVHLSVVDVVGKGVSAAKDALAVTHALRMLAIGGTPVLDLVGGADTLLHRAFPDLAATVMVARFDPADGRLVLASGGHPPPLLLSDGAARFLEPSGRAVGWPEAGSDDVVDVVLAPGDSVVFYTDGLVEAQRDIVLGLQALQSAALDLAELKSIELAEALVQHVLADASRVDDSLVVVLRRTR